MIVKVLGSGCANCQRLTALVKEAVEHLGLSAEVVKVTDFADIMAYGVMSTPALVIDERLALAGRVPTLDELESLLKRTA